MPERNFKRLPENGISGGVSMTSVNSPVQRAATGWAAGRAAARLASMSSAENAQIEGEVSAGFEPVRDAFARNFAERGERGGACCVYHKGEKIVDLWGGKRDRKSGAPWRADTMVLVYSATKGMAAMVMALAHSRGWIDYDRKVAAYWPEFACYGKEKTTVRQLLAHQAGLPFFGEKVDKRTVSDLDRLAEVMARQKPVWPPGSRVAYHAITLGFYEGELIRRTDPQHRTLGQVFQEEIAAPLGLDAYIRLPESIPNERLAVLKPANMWKMFANFHFPLLVAALWPRSVLFRALMVNPGSHVSMDAERIYARNLEVPSGGGVVSARGLAGAYNAFASVGQTIGLKAETQAELMAPPVPSEHGFYDECLKGELEYSLGFMRPNKNWTFGRHASAFGTPGAGGALGYADPEDGVAYAYVTGRMGARITADPRDMALREALDACLAKG